MEQEFQFHYNLRVKTAVCWTQDQNARITLEQGHQAGAPCCCHKATKKMCMTFSPPMLLQQLNCLCCPCLGPDPTLLSSHPSVRPGQQDISTMQKAYSKSRPPCRKRHPTRKAACMPSGPAVTAAIEPLSSSWNLRLRKIWTCGNITDLSQSSSHMRTGGTCKLACKVRDKSLNGVHIYSFIY